MSPAPLSSTRSFLLAGGVATLASCGGENLVDPTTGALEAIPRHTEISNRLGLHVFATEDDDAMMRRVAAAG